MSPNRKSPSPKSSNPIPPEIEPEVKELEETVRVFARTFIKGGIPVGTLLRRLRDAAFEEVREHEPKHVEVEEKPATKPGIKKIPAPPQSQVDVTVSRRKRGELTKKMKDVGLRRTA